MDWEIGEIRQINDEWYQCLESNNCRCDYCELDGVVDCCKIACMSNERIDNKDVCFKKLEKVGKLYNDCGTILQRFKIYTNVTNADTKGLELHIYSNNTIGIEIKQFKEDISVSGKTINECLLDNGKLNLKPFDIQKAKEGKPVCTRDGRKARIICFDLNNDEYPIVAAITNNGKEDELYKYDINGINGTIGILDLMMLPEKKEGWIKVKKDVNLYDTKEEADRKMIGNTDYVTAKVFWEE